MDDKTLAAVCTPIRDLRDEVWVRVYAAEIAKENLGAHNGEHFVRVVMQESAKVADLAVAYMPIPAHRQPEGA